MLRFLVTLFLILHGLVHLLYAGQSVRLFELQPGMVWPDGSLTVARFLGDERTRVLTAGLLAIAAFVFVCAGIGAFTGQPWWRSLVVGAALFSSLLFLVTWDGGWQNLDDKGAVGVLINGLVTGVVLLA